MAVCQCGTLAEGKATRSALRAVAVGLLLAIVVPAGCSAPEVRDERLVRFVDELVFGGPFDAHHEQDKRVTRWSGDMRVAITGQRSEDYHDPLADHVARMAALSGLDARMVAAGKGEANVVVELVSKNDFLINREFVDCYARLQGQGNQIDRATVFIGVAQAEGFRDCVVHELMHVFGFRYHSGIVRSVMSPTHGEHELTEWDKLAFRVLFDPRLEVGAPRDQALQIIRQIIRETRVGD